MNTGHTSLTKNFNIFWRKPKSMCGNNIRAEDSEGIKIFYRRHSAMQSLAVMNLLFGLRKMDMNLQSPLTSKLHCPQNHRLAYRIDCVNRYGEHRMLRPGQRLLIHLHALNLLSFGLFRSIPVTDHICKHRSYPHLESRLSCHRHMPIMIIECCGAGLYHL